MGESTECGKFGPFLESQLFTKVEPISLKEYADIISNLQMQFNGRFQDFRVLEPHFQQYSTPFAVKIDNVADELQMELAELQCDTILKQNDADVELLNSISILQRKCFQNCSLLQGSPINICQLNCYWFHRRISN